MGDSEEEVGCGIVTVAASFQEFEPPEGSK